MQYKIKKNSKSLMEEYAKELIKDEIVKKHHQSKDHQKLTAERAKTASKGSPIKNRKKTNCGSEVGYEND